MRTLVVILPLKLYVVVKIQEKIYVKLLYIQSIVKYIKLDTSGFTKRKAEVMVMKVKYWNRLNPKGWYVWVHAKKSTLNTVC